MRKEEPSNRSTLDTDKWEARTERERAAEKMEAEAKHTCPTCQSGLPRQTLASACVLSEPFLVPAYPHHKPADQEHTADKARGQVIKF